MGADRRSVWAHHQKIWVTAVDSDAIAKAGAGTDPSHPPFYLPGQELLAGNAKAYWSIPSCVQPSSSKTNATLCDSNLDCCGGTPSPATSVCALDTPLTNPPVRHCVPVSTSTCIADNSATACNIDAECCNNVTLGSICVNNVCQKPPPVFVYLPDQFSRNYQMSCSDPAQLPIWREVQWKGSIPAWDECGLLHSDCRHRNSAFHGRTYACTRHRDIRRSSGLDDFL